jgi:hypothetical protein
MNKAESHVKKNEIFVGNTCANEDMSYLKGIKYRLGDQAFDIHGKKLAKDYVLPLFIDKKDMNRYDSIMMAGLYK